MNGKKSLLAGIAAMLALTGGLAMAAGEAGAAPSNLASSSQYRLEGTVAGTRVITARPGDSKERRDTAIDQRYAAEPGLQALLGKPKGHTVNDGGVWYRDYERGRLYWTPSTGVHYMTGAIFAKYLQLGAHHKFGAPTTDELGTPDGVGRYNHFTGTPATRAASIYWTPKTGAHAVWGAIRQHWAETGFERGPLGYPKTDELGTSDGVGRYNHFSKEGSIYWTPSTGAHEVYGAIRERWAGLGWERSYLGYPTSSQFSVPGGSRSNFEHGYIWWNRGTDTTIDRRY